jgi:hypothetical protein
MEKSNNIEDKYEFLANKSKDLLKEQIDSYTINHGKAGNVAAITIAMITFFLFIMDFENLKDWLIYLSMIPLVLIIISFYYLLKVFLSKKLLIGFKPEKLDKLSTKEYIKILQYEIGANKKSFTTNRKLVTKQNNWFKKGIYFTISAGLILIILVILSQLNSGKNNIDSDTIKIIKKEKIMENQDTNLDNDSANESSEQIQSDDNEYSNIPDVSLDDLEPFEKDINSEPLTKDMD